MLIKLKKETCFAKKKIRLKTFACRRCSVKSTNNIKSHKHVRNHYIKFLLLTLSKLFLILFALNSL